MDQLSKTHADVDLELIFLDESSPDDDIHWLCGASPESGPDTHSLCQTMDTASVPVPGWVEVNCEECKKIFDAWNKVNPFALAMCSKCLSE